MRLLVLGGSVFLSHAVAADAVRRGHDVTCANRGSSGPVPDGARAVVWDRTEPVPEALTDDFDAVVDVARSPSWVRSAVAAFPSAHWVFVSTVNVYPDPHPAGGTPTTLTLREPLHDDVDPLSSPEAYGRMKVACEEVVRASIASWTVIRPGLIVGPGDPSGRFTYWPARLADGGPALAGGDPADALQVIDVRDLAAWIVSCAETRLPGDYDGVGEVLPVGAILEQVAEGVGAAADLTWVADAVSDGARGRAVVGARGPPPVAPPPGVRRHGRPRSHPVVRRRPGHQTDRRHRPRHPRLAAGDAGRSRDRHQPGAGGRGARSAALSG